LFSGRR